MQKVIRIYIIELDIFDDDNSNADNVKDNIEKNDSKNLSLLIANLYSYVVAIIYIHWKKNVVIDYLKFSM